MLRNLISFGILVCSAVVPNTTSAQFATAASDVSLERYPNVDSTADVVEKWSSEHHLYVQGDLGITHERLTKLEEWLDKNGPNWTVVLMRTARDEHYESLDRRTFRSLDAAEYALGRGLALRTSFSDLVDERTGETNGAVFALFLDEKKFSYYASVAQDTRNLGEAHWLGELDRPAFRAMRGGGRIIDAVKETITNINTRLTQKIEAEQEQAEREKLARQRALAHLQADIQSLRQGIDTVDENAANVKRDFPAAEGELANPPSVSWRRQLDEIDGMLTHDNIAAMKSRFNNVSHEVESFLNAYSTYATFDQIVTPLEAQISELKADEIRAGRDMAEEAAQHLVSARDVLAQGRRGLADVLAEAESSLVQGQQLVADEVARIERRAARHRLILRSSAATAGFLALAAGGMLVWLNRKRVPAKERAEAALTARDAEVTQELERVYGLFERSNEILGNKERAEKRGYVGTTKQLTGNVFEDVDDLFVMSSEVQRVMNEARELILPRNIIGRLANLFGDSLYERGVNRMSGEPLTFHRNKGLPLVIQRESERTGEEPPEEVTMTFDKVFAAFHERTATAEQTLNILEHSLIEADDLLLRLQERIEAASALDRELADASDDDGLFAIPAYFENLIPSAQDDFDAADEIIGVDPVRVMQDLVPSGMRKINEAGHIAETIQQARKELFPALNELAPQLQSLEYNTGWIQGRIAQLGEQANELLEEAVVRSIGSEATAFTAATVALGEEVHRALKLAQSLVSDAAPSLSDLEQRTSAARTEIASVLSLPAEQCLNEYDARPDESLASGRKLFAAAQAALQHGGVEVATQAVEQLNAEIETGTAVIEKSLSILHGFDNSKNETRRHFERIAETLPHHQQTIEEIHNEFADTALLIHAADASFEDKSATVDTQLAAGRAALDNAQSQISRAADNYHQAGLIESSVMLAEANREIELSATLLSTAAAHCTALRSTNRENEGELDVARRAIESLHSQVQDRRTMRPTLTDNDRILQDIKSTQGELRGEEPRDPFRDAAAIASFRQAIGELEAQIGRDHDAYEEAVRALQGAKSERDVAEQLIQQASQDGIPDSPTTKETIGNIRAFDATLSRIERELNGEHGDWRRVDQDASRFHGQLGVETARLRGELEHAQRTAAVFQSASDAVFEATRWSGGFGTRIFGSPGARELERARRALHEGNYTAMAELAQAAQVMAQQAIQRAQREVYRKQREAARQAEEARRRRRRDSVRSGGGGLSFPSSSSRSGSSSSGSSRSPSGSGFSRSGW